MGLSGPWLGDDVEVVERQPPFFVSTSMQEKPVKIFSFNPYGAKINDCAIRAICAAIGMKYELVCKEFNVSWKKG